MFYILIFIAALILTIGIFLFVFVVLKTKKLGVVTGSRIYQDTRNNLGNILYSEMLCLKGKPDYVMNIDSQFIPVELKTGKTPAKPYLNHIMQLIAYCALVEENYHTRPKYGILKYPNREFKVLYSEERKQTLLQLIAEIIANKKNNTEFKCTHEYHR